MHHILANQSWLSACLQNEYDAVASIIINVIRSIMDGIGEKNMHWGQNSQKENWYRDHIGSRTFLG